MITTMIDGGHLHYISAHQNMYHSTDYSRSVVIPGSLQFLRKKCFTHILIGSYVKQCNKHIYLYCDGGNLEFLIHTSKRKLCKRPSNGNSYTVWVQSSFQFLGKIIIFIFSYDNVLKLYFCDSGHLGFPIHMIYENFVKDHPII